MPPFTFGAQNYSQAEKSNRTTLYTMHPLLSSLSLICYIASLYACVASALTQLTDSNINAAADLWVSNEAQALATYGNIANWNTSQVTTLKQIFAFSGSDSTPNPFNGDIAKVGHEQGDSHDGSVL